MVLCSFGCCEVGNSNLYEEKNRQNHREGGLETPRQCHRQKACSAPASPMLRKEEQRFR